MSALTGPVDQGEEFNIIDLVGQDGMALTKDKTPQAEQER